jgi:transketolase
LRLSETESAAPISELRRKADALREDILEMLLESRTGHPGSSLSALEILVALYYRVLRFDPARPDAPDRDRVILSKGHAAPALYAVLIDLGVLPEEARHTLRQLGSPLQGHPDRRFAAGIDASTGSLGQGLSMGVGLALGSARLGRDTAAYVVLGDGECQEGQVWEAAMAAAHLRLGNLTAIVDWNGLQHDRPIAEVIGLDPFPEKWSAFGWDVEELDGHDLDALVKTLETPHERPLAILAHTVKGHGVPFMENRVEWHSIKDPALFEELMAEVRA